MPVELPQIDVVQHSIAKLAALLEVVDHESIAVSAAAGRILAQPLLADRDSPALSVSAMDGYALRVEDLGQGPLPVAATVAAGSAPVALPTSSAVRIFTGAPVPEEANCVVRREDTTESPGRVGVNIPVEILRRGQHIRVRGENTARGDEILRAGTVLDSVAMAAVASFAAPNLNVRRKLRVSILNTGDELAAPGEPVADWQIRDSNGPVLESWLGGLPWSTVVARRHVADVFDEVKSSLRNALDESDVVLLTGGVSMGDADYVPGAIDALGGQIVFHRLPIRPGRPILGAMIGGKLVLGLPGNPVSVAVTSRVFGLPLLKACAGVQAWSNCAPRVQVANPDGQAIDLIWYRLVQLDAGGRVEFAISQGSGDLVSLSRSYGFVELPPGQTGAGPWPLYRWS